MQLGILRTGALLLLAVGLFAQSPTASVLGSASDPAGAAATGITRSESVTVDGTFENVGTLSADIGNVVTGRELVDLPLNGRTFTQLGLLQPGVAPLPQGLLHGGGSIRSSQTYAINDAKPEANLCLFDGVGNVNRMDAGSPRVWQVGMKVAL